MPMPLQREPQLHMRFVIPGHPEQDGRLSMHPNQLGRKDACEALKAAGGDRVAIYFLANGAGTPVYVHAKAVLLDDLWGCIDSDKPNRRSWTYDSELSAAFMDSSREGHVRSLRRALAQEHLGSNFNNEAVPAQQAFFNSFRETAAALDVWHFGGKVGPRPAGRVRALTQEQVPRRTQAGAMPLYRIVYGPDGRTRRLRRVREF